MGRNYQRKKKHAIPTFFLFFLLPLLLLSLSFVHFERKMLPSLQEISHMRSKALANQMIDEAIQSLMKETSVTSSDFLLPVEESGNYSANTSLINSFCSRLSQKLDVAMGEIPKEVIEVPLGAATNSNLFANMGPTIPFTLLPAGSVTSDYETEFLSAGINQINYKIWLHVTLEVQIVNPLYREKIVLTRKIMLVDTVISGKVPENYINMGQNGNIS